jgi:dipeptidyl aminopeptidase/acylaminoacyl peptidase
MFKHCFLTLSFLVYACIASAQSYTMEAVTSYPFITELTAAPKGAKIAFTVFEKGIRNIYVSEGPNYTPRKLTAYTKDDGQEITSVSVSADGKWVVYVLGGDHGAFDESEPRNPASSTEQPKVQVCYIPFEGGKTVVVTEGDYPIISPNSEEVAYQKNNQIWVSPLNGTAASKRLFYVRGSVGYFKWSPDGKSIVFVSSRNDHSLIGIYERGAEDIKWIAPTFSRDQSPQWSPDGKQIVFVRRPSRGGFTDSLTRPVYQPWSIWKADVSTTKATQLWKAPETLRGSLPGTNGGTNLRWAANSRIVYVSYEDGWPHLYSLPENGGKPLLLTPGAFALEHVKLSTDGKWLFFSTNAGSGMEARDRRHVARVPVDKAAMEILTPGTGLESNAVPMSDGKSIALLHASVQQPNLPGILDLGSKKIKSIGKELIPAEFPANKLITPKSVEFKASDGNPVYGQLFEPAGGKQKKPAVLFIHGGPQRQMLLGWHFGDYYSNTYALNQYLASQGFVVLSVNYRLGVGYGYDFQYPSDGWTSGASEYLDIEAAGKWLAAQPQVDAKRVGVYGGSYGGYLTAMALAKDSKIFAAGVDIHGEHNLNIFLPKESAEPAPDYELAKSLNWKSSPIAYLDTWTSPVLIIHGDDDGNVPFRQSVDLVNRLEKLKIPYETLMIPDETHHWMKYKNLVKVDEATAEFLIRKLK